MAKYKRSTFYFNGKQYAAYGKTQKEADQKAALKESALKRGDVGVSDNMSVQRWGEKYLTVYRRPSVGDATYKNYEYIINELVCNSIGNMRLKDVKDIHLQEIVNSLAGGSGYYISRVINLIKGMFKQARYSKLLQFDPSEQITPPKAVNGKRRSLTDSEREHFISVADTRDHGGAEFMAILYLGIRPAELRALSWKDIDLENKYVHIKSSVTSGTENIGATKSEAGVRDVPIPDIFLPYLIKPASISPFEPVFTQQTNSNRHTKSSFRKLWLSFKKDIDINMGAKYEWQKNEEGKRKLVCTLSVIDDNLSPYYLRHTYCTDLQRAGVPINVAKYLMGHSDIKMTAAIYTHTTSDVIEDARTKINVKNDVTPKEIAN